MKQISMPMELRVCPHCRALPTPNLPTLNYYHEAPNGADYYYCANCYGIVEWDSHDVKAVDGEAYPNRDKSKAESSNGKSE